MKMSCFANTVHCGSVAARLSDHVSVIRFAPYSYFSPCPLRLFFFFHHCSKERKIKPFP